MTDSESDCKVSREADPRTEQFLQLLGLHERNLFTYVFALVPTWADAEEVMQRLRIRVWQQFDKYDPEKPFDAWARAVAYYLVLAYRKEKGRKRELFSERILEEITIEFENGLLQSNQRREALLGCLNKLGDRKRDLIRTYYLSSQRKSTEVLAAELSMTPNALRQALFRIRRVLLDCVERTMRIESRE